MASSVAYTYCKCPVMLPAISAASGSLSHRIFLSSKGSNTCNRSSMNNNIRRGTAIRLLENGGGRGRGRPVVACAKPKSEENLVLAIQSQIESALQLEKEKEAFDENIEEVLMPFELEDTPGYMSVILRRKYGNEEITLEALPAENGDIYDNEEDDDEGTQQQEAGEDDDEGTQQHEAGEDDDEGTQQHEAGEDDDDDVVYADQLSFTVSVKKGSGRFLQFDCIADSDEVVIDSLTLIDPELQDPDKVAYEARFQDFDEKLQRSWHKFLEVRGITPKLADYLNEYLIHKDSKEYIRWLENLQAFVQFRS